MAESIICVGKGGLGRAFERKGIKCLSHNELDITDYCAVNNVLGQYKPKYVINCAAVVGVEKCNKDTKRSYLVNVVGVVNLALYCRDNNSKLIHISTAYSGNTNFYSKTKLLSENIVEHLIRNSLIIKLPWVFGRDFNNYINDAICGSKVTIFKDEYFYLVYDNDVVSFILNNIDRCGKVSIANKGLLSREDIVEYIGCEYNSIYRDSQFDNNILIDFYMRPWDEALCEFINESGAVQSAR